MNIISPAILTYYF